MGLSNAKMDYNNKERLRENMNVEELINDVLIIRI